MSKKKSLSRQHLVQSAQVRVEILTSSDEPKLGEEDIWDVCHQGSEELDCEWQRNKEMHKNFQGIDNSCNDVSLPTQTLAIASTANDSEYTADDTDDTLCS